MVVRNILIYGGVGGGLHNSTKVKSKSWNSFLTIRPRDAVNFTFQRKMICAERIAEDERVDSKVFIFSALQKFFFFFHSYFLSSSS